MSFYTTESNHNVHVKMTKKGERKEKKKKGEREKELSPIKTSFLKGLT